MEDRLKTKVKTFMVTVLELVNNIPQDEHRKQVVLKLAGKLKPMRVIHNVGDTKIQDGIGFQSKNAIIVDHKTFQFEFDESKKYAFEVIDNISHNERRQLLDSIREVVWDFHNLVKTMIEPWMEEEGAEEAT